LSVTASIISCDEADCVFSICVPVPQPLAQSPSRLGMTPYGTSIVLPPTVTLIVLW
jgi:hypothetical protein